MSRIELRNSTVRIIDGYSNTAAINGSVATADTDMDIDTLGTDGVIPVNCQFTVVGSIREYRVTAATSNGVYTLDLGGGSGGTYTLTFLGATTTALAFGADAAAIQAAIEALAGIGAGNVTVAGLVITFIGDLAKTDVAGTADFASLTGATDPALTETYVGGTTRNITFTPALLTADGVPSDGAVISFTGRTVEVTVGEGNLTFTENTEIIYDRDRGLLDTTREGEEQPMDVTLDMTWDFLLNDTESTELPTPYEAFNNISNASDWISSSADLCEPYAVDIQVTNVPRCTTEKAERYTFPDFRKTSLGGNISDAQISVQGQCNATKPIITRVWV